jgi:hypothetical protein
MFDFAKNPGGYALRCEGGTTSTSGEWIDANGIPHKTYVKDLIRVGNWVMPSSGMRFAVTHKDLEHWVKTFSTMETNGVEVHVPIGHTNDGDKNAGFLRGMFIEGDELKGKLELIGRKAIEMASTNFVSVYVPREMTDGKGNVYERPIEHVALTPTPVISGQGGFVPIAASRGQVTVPVLTLDKGVSKMEILKRLAEAVGVEVSDDMDEVAIEAAIKSKFTSMKASYDKVPELEASIKASREEAEAVKLELSRKTVEQPSPVVLKLSRENRAMKLAGLVEKSKITPAVSKALAAKWIDGNALELSLDANSDERFDAMVAALAENDVVELGKVKIELSRNTPGGDKPDVEGTTKRMLSSIGQ